MIILEYKLDATDAGMKCPPWIDDGGYWADTTNYTMIGVTRDNPEFHIPSTVVRLTPAELEARQLAIHAITPAYHEPNMETEEDAVMMTDAEVSTMIQEWVASKGET